MNNSPLLSRSGDGAVIAFSFTVVIIVVRVRSSHGHKAEKSRHAHSSFYVSLELSKGVIEVTLKPNFLVEQNAGHLRLLSIDHDVVQEGKHVANQA